jgi:hypothetical protein
MKKKSVRNNPKKQEDVVADRIEKKESTSAPMRSAKESLDTVKMLLSMNGFNVKELPPTRREHSSAAFKKPDVYMSPIEFSINGMGVGLYGNVLVIQDVVTKGNYDIHNIPAVYKFIVSKMKQFRGVQQSATKKAAIKAESKTDLTKTVSFMSRYFSGCMS